jgi:alpha-mannosidase
MSAPSSSGAIPRLRQLAAAVRDGDVFPAGAPLEVRAWQTPDRLDVREAAAKASAGAFVPVPIGWRWGPAWSTAWFHVRGEVPAAWRGRRVVLRFDCGTEALLWARTRNDDRGTGAGRDREWVPRQGFDRNRDAAVLLERADGGEVVDMLIEAACNHPLGGGGRGIDGLFWETEEFRARWREAKPGLLARCELAVMDEGAWAVWRGAEFVAGLVSDGGESAEPFGETLAEEASEWVERFRRAGSERRPIDDDDRGQRRVSELAGIVRKCLSGAESVPPVAGRAPAAPSGLPAPSPPIAPSRCIAVGHAHLDTAWLWPAAETRRKALRTFATALRLMERFGEFRFAASQAQQYAWVREASPALFAEVAARVREGRWEPVGAMWVEPDGNLPSGESFVRQILHGTRWWQGAFGQGAPPQRVAYLPDTFGFAGSLPQVFRLAGLDTFITNKLWWNDTTEFPHVHFRWRGIDGTEILSHLTPGREYNATMTPAELARGRAAARRQSPPVRAEENVWLQPFGYGDGGGGPTDWMILNARLAAGLEGLAGLPRVEPGGIADFCAALHAMRAGLRARGEDLPVVEGELYLQKHRGTYTTQGRVKQGNARAEADLRIAEWLTWAGPADAHGEDARAAAAALDRAWKRTLLNQFHDILPGSSIGAVYDDAARDHAYVAETAAALIRRGERRVIEVLDTRGARDPVVVFNPGSGVRSGWVEWDDPSAAGAGVARKRGMFVRDVPGLGARVADAAAAEPVEPARLEGRTLRNGIIEAHVDEAGQVARLLHVATGRDAVGEGPLNQLALYEDRPRHWEAWEIEAGYEIGRVADGVRPGPAVVAAPPAPVMETPAEGAASLVVERAVGRASRVVQRFVLAPGSPRLEIRTWIDWREERRMLRALFPVSVRNERARFEIPFGSIERPTGSATPEQRAMFEVPAHRWMDLADADGGRNGGGGRGGSFGVAVLNDGRYGCSCRGSVMGLTLLKSPRWPDERADLGEHEFVYSLMPHAGDWRAAGVDAEAELMVRGMWAVPAAPGRVGGAGPVGPAWAPLAVEASGGARLRIAAVKRGEDGRRLVVRVVESHGAQGNCEIRWGMRVEGVQAADLLERPMELAGFAHDRGAGVTRFPVRAFQIVTVAADVAAPRAARS